MFVLLLYTTASTCSCYYNPAHVRVIIPLQEACGPTGVTFLQNFHFVFETIKAKQLYTGIKQ